MYAVDLAATQHLLTSQHLLGPLSSPFFGVKFLYAYTGSDEQRSTKTMENILARGLKLFPECRRRACTPWPCSVGCRAPSRGAWWCCPASMSLKIIIIHDFRKPILGGIAAKENAMANGISIGEKCLETEERCCFFRMVKNISSVVLQKVNASVDEIRFRWKTK